MGRPQRRWREMHQSLRSRTMALIRSMPQPGTQRTSSQAATASSLKGVHGAEPLGGGPEDDGVLAAPAVGILVDDVFHAQQMAAFPDMLQNHLVGGPDLQAGKFLAGFFGQAAGGIHRHDDGQLRIVTHASVKVLGTVAGSSVNAAGAAVQRDMVAQNYQAGAIQEGMLIFHQFQVTAGNAHIQHGIVFHTAGLHGSFHAVSGHDMVILTNLDEGVVKVGMQAGGHVGGQSPGGGGPDHDPGFVQRHTGLGQHAVGIAGQLEADIQRITLVLTVLDFGFRQSGLVFGAPVHNTLALIDVALFGHFAEDLHLAGLKLGAQVR